MMLRIGVTGGRYYNDRGVVDGTLSLLSHLATLVHGDAPGADTLCAKWWVKSYGTEPESYPADWGKHGKAAGPIRNQEMVDSGLDLLVAFPGGRGTADMVARARKAGVPILEVPSGQ